MTDAETAQAALYWLCGRRLREIAARYGKSNASAMCSVITAFILKYHPSPPVNRYGGIRYNWGRVAVLVPPHDPTYRPGVAVYEFKRVNDPARWMADPTAAYPGIDRKVLTIEAINAWCRQQPAKPRLQALLVKQPRTRPAQSGI